MDVNKSVSPRYRNEIIVPRVCSSSMLLVSRLFICFISLLFDYMCMRLPLIPWSMELKAFAINSIAGVPSSRVLPVPVTAPQFVWVFQKNPPNINFWPVNLLFPETGWFLFWLIIMFPQFNVFDRKLILKLLKNCISGIQFFDSNFAIIPFKFSRENSHLPVKKVRHGPCSIRHYVCNDSQISI